MLTAQQGFTYNKFEKPTDWPKIEDTFDYKYENGYLIGGNEHLYLSGPVNYEVTGSPVIKDNIASGFSANNYLVLSTNAPISSNKMEFYTKVTTGSSLPSYGYALRYKILSNDKSGIGITGSSTIGWYLGKDSNNENVFIRNYGITASPNATYYLKATIENNIAALYYNTTGFVDTMTKIGERDLSTLSVVTTPEILTYGGSSNSWNGSIDLSQTYIKVNNKLWFYGKNYTTKYMTPVPKGLEYNGTITPKIGWVYTSNELVKGLVEYTKVGNPVIKDGVVSGFSSANLIKTSQEFLSSFTHYEIVLRAKINSSGSAGLLCSATGSTGSMCLLFNSSMLRFSPYSGSDYVGISGVTFSLSDYYYIKIVRLDDTITLAYSIDGNTWLGNVSKQFSQLTSSNGLIALGGISETASYFPGSIDLNQTYIKVNNQPWFGSISKFQEFIEAPEGTTLEKDDPNMLTVETPTINGQVDYTKVGSPTIENNIASGFSNSDYFKLPYLPGETTAYFTNRYPFELVIKFKKESSGTSQLIYGDLNIVLDTTANVNFNNGTSTIYIDGTTTLQLNTYYCIKIVYNGSNVSYYLKEENNDYILQGSSDNSVTRISDSLNLGCRLGQQYLDGSIDLSQTYIKINNQYWFKPVTEVLDTKLAGPVNYTVVGSPSITDGVVSGFSSSDYLQIAQSFTLSPTTKAMFHLEYTTDEIFPQTGGITIFNLNDFNIFGMYKANASGWFYWTSSIWGDMYEDSNNNYKFASANTKYKVDMNFTGEGIATIDIYNENNVLQIHKERIITATTTGNINIAKLSANERKIKNIDLNSTYIKVNGKLWFGKENWAPSTYKDNSIYLTAGQNSTYNELSFTPTISNNGTYDVWVDNQKIYEEQQAGTKLEWDKLNLTTGYNITTPSSMKAHIVKICPTDDTNTIEAYKAGADYIVGGAN